MIKRTNIVVNNNLAAVLMVKGNRAYLQVIGDISWWKNGSGEFTRKVDELIDSGIIDLDLYLNSGGGSVFDANEIANQIKRFTGDRRLQVGALCASAATTILTAFEKAKTKCAKNANFMLHNPTTGVHGEAKDMRSATELLDNVKEQILDEYETRMTLSRKKISVKMDNTWWLTAKQAVKEGLISSIDDAINNSMPQDTAEVFNKYGYDHIPEVLNKLLTPNKPVEKTDPKQEILNSIKLKMKNLLLMLMASFPSMASIANLGDESTEAEVHNALVKFVQAKDARIAELELQIKGAGEGQLKDLLDNAIKEKKITADMRTNFETMANDGGERGFDNVKAVIDGLTPKTGVLESLKLDNKNKDERKDWTWDQFIENGFDNELQAMEKEDPERFASLHAAYMKAEPK